MKIFLVGGGSGGHFYPLVAVARSIFKIAEKERVAKISFFLTSDKSMEKILLEREEIKFVQIPAGKIRRYFSLLNATDLIKTFFGILIAFFRIYQLLPDVIFSKGGYAAFPVLVSARILKIPVIIHESDSVPGLVNKWAGKWVQRVAVSFPETSRFFDPQKTIVTGNPIRVQILGGNETEAIQHFNLEVDVPVVLILTGSQGATKINETILDILPELLEKYQVIHQIGEKNFKDVESRVGVILEKVILKHRYHPFQFLNEGSLKNAGKAASIVVSRAGAGSIFEIAGWGLPSIIIPIYNSAQNHQRENSYNYARTGACEVIEEPNLKPRILLSQIDKILSNEEKMKKMSEAAKYFSRPDAADVLAHEIIKLGIHD
jgi:UDP-N-acetylglucosamine--N-acetylmuramyl-(pentapeptide) pyrophosphoryl-undecaprenol N-acetylglucosamine transferase